MSEKNLKILGWIGTLLSVIMYVSYVPQIVGNLHGNKTFFLQPLAAAVNCTIWTSYGLLKEKKRLSFISSKLSRGSLWATCNNYGILDNLILKIYCKVHLNDNQSFL